MTKIVGVAGAIGAGKSTFASMLCNKMMDDGQDVWQTAMAAPLYAVAQNLGFHIVITDQSSKDKEQILKFPCAQAALQDAIEAALGDWPDNDKAETFALTWDELSCGGHIQQEAGYLDVIQCSLRHFLRTLGNAARTINPDIWADYLVHRASAVVPNGYVIVGDIRFPSEMYVCDVLVWLDGGEVGRSDDVSESHHKLLREKANIIIDNSAKDFEYLQKLAAMWAGDIYGK